MISVIIPAYNEEKNISNVLKVLKNISILEEIIVVNDGSTDDTVKVAQEFNIKIVNNTKNMGKSYAVKVGVMESKCDMIVMLDADLIGFNESHFIQLVDPVINGKADVTIGIFSSGRKLTDFAQKIAPFLSGQRAMKRNLLIDFFNDNDIDIFKYGFEVALTKYLKMHNFRIINVPLKNMSHVMKEEKLGFFKGFYTRLIMYKDILKALI